MIEHIARHVGEYAKGGIIFDIMVILVMSWVIANEYPGLNAINALMVSVTMFYLYMFLLAIIKFIASTLLHWYIYGWNSER